MADAAIAHSTLGPAVIAILAAFYLLGGFVKGTIAFGQPLIVIPLSSFFVSIPTAIAISIGPIAISNVVQIAQNRHAFPRVRRYWPFYLGILAGIPLGFLVLVHASSAWLSFVVGSAILLFLALRVSGYRPPVGPVPTPGILAGTGFFSGISAGATSFVSFPSLLVLTSYRLERREFALTAALMFLLSGLVLGGGLTAMGVLGPVELFTALFCMLPTAGGQILGQRVRDRVDEETLFRAVYAMLTAASLGLISKPFF